MICALILAAGESRRMGELKPLIKINGKTFLQHIVEQLGRANVEDVTIVLGFEAEKIKRDCGLEAVRFVMNPAFRQGQFSSLQAGIRSLPPECDGVIVCLGDQPQTKAAWVRKILEAALKSGAPIITPKFGVKRGHPIYFSSSLFEEILTMHPTQTAHDLKRNHHDAIFDVHIDDEGILFDVDTPEDLEKLRTVMSR